MSVQILSRQLLDLASSMRFAISLLTVISIASVAGTVVRQGEAYNAYLNQFGPFWFRAFEAAGLYAVYSAPWFIAILAFLVVSVSVCLSRNAPRMLREMRTLRENGRAESLRLMPQHAEFALQSAPAAAAARALAYLRREGFAAAVRADGERMLVSAKAGSANRLGYLLAHSAIVAICIGGLADSNVPLQLQLALGERKSADPASTLAQVPASARLGPGNFSFRGNTFVPEGQSSDVSVVNIGDGILVQELPYRISLKKFHIEHYSTGQPRLFASDVIITDKDSGKSFEARIEVNRPLIHKGIAAYQSSFDDGGTSMALKGHHLLAPRARTLEFDGRVGETSELKYADTAYRVEFTGFRPINVENVSAAPVEPAGGGILDRLRRQMGTGNEALSRRDLRNVGPSFTYKLRDPAGQAREYHNYMLPLQFDGRWMLVSGMREDPNEPFRYLRIPLDEDGRLDGFWQLRAGLLDSARRDAIARQFAATAMKDGAAAETLRERLAESTERTLETFTRRGYQSVAEFLERAVPEAEREQAADIYLRVLQGAAWEAWQDARLRAGQPALESTPQRTQFVHEALNAISDTFHYGVPVYLQLISYDEVKASVFQMTRSPGRNLVYLGCALLIAGVFAMLYIRERRAWLILEAGCPALFAMACNRKTLDFDREFARHRTALAAELAADGAAARSAQD